MAPAPSSRCPPLQVRMVPAVLMWGPRLPPQPLPLRRSHTTASVTAFLVAVALLAMSTGPDATEAAHLAGRVLWAGGLTHDSAELRVQCDNIPAEVVVSRSESLSRPSFSETVTRPGIARVSATGLLAGTRYFYGIAGKDTDVGPTGSVGTFVTPAAPAGSPMSFTVAFSSAAFTGAEGDVFTQLAERNGFTPQNGESPVSSGGGAESVLMFLHMGDMHFMDITSDSSSVRAASYDTVFSSATQAYLYRSIPVVYMFDDHDFCGPLDELPVTAHAPSGSSAACTGRNVARIAYHNYVPHYPFAAANVSAAGGGGGGGGSGSGSGSGSAEGGHASSGSAALGQLPVYQGFTLGRVRFLVTDLQSAVREEHFRDSTLGREQREWLLAELAACGHHKVVVWVSTKPWVQPDDPSGDGWGGFADERRIIADTIRDSGCDNVLMLEGDAREVSADDGSHSDFGSTVTSPSDHGDGGAAGMPVFHAAPLFQYGTTKDTGPYSGGCHGARYNRRSQYGVLSIDDPGAERGGAADPGAPVCVSFTGINADDPEPPLVSMRLCVPFVRNGTHGGGECTLSLGSPFLAATMLSAALLICCGPSAMLWCRRSERRRRLRQQALSRRDDLGEPLVAGDGEGRARGGSKTGGMGAISESDSGGGGSSADGGGGGGGGGIDGDGVDGGDHVEADGNELEHLTNWWLAHRNTLLWVRRRAGLSVTLSMIDVASDIAVVFTWLNTDVVRYDWVGPGLGVLLASLAPAAAASVEEAIDGYNPAKRNGRWMCARVLLSACFLRPVALLYDVCTTRRRDTLTPSHPFQRLEEARMFEAVVEAFPQALLQTFVLVLWFENSRDLIQSGVSFSGNAVLVQMVSIAVSIVSLGMGVVDARCAALPREWEGAEMPWYFEYVQAITEVAARLFAWALWGAAFGSGSLLVCLTVQVLTTALLLTSAALVPAARRHDPRGWCGVGPLLNLAVAAVMAALPAVMGDWLRLHSWRSTRQDVSTGKGRASVASRRWEWTVMASVQAVSVLVVIVVSLSHPDSSPMCSGDAAQELSGCLPGGLVAVIILLWLLSNSLMYRMITREVLWEAGVRSDVDRRSGAGGAAPAGIGGPEESDFDLLYRGGAVPAGRSARPASMRRTAAGGGWMPAPGEPERARPWPAGRGGGPSGRGSSAYSFGDGGGRTVSKDRTSQLVRERDVSDDFVSA